MMCRRIRVFFSLILALAAVNVGADRCNDVPEVFVAMPKEIVEIWNENVGRSVIRVRMAVSARQRAAGFQNVCEAEIARFPLLFVFDRDVRTRFHMQNVQTALNIAFFHVLVVLSVASACRGRRLVNLAGYMGSSHLIAMRWSSVAMSCRNY